MSSIIAETLIAGGVDGGDRCTPDLAKLSLQSDELKLEIMNFLKGKYEDFDVQLDKTNMLYKRYEQLNTALNSTSQLIQREAKISTSPDYTGVSTELDRVTCTLHILESLLAVHQLHQSVNDHISAKEYCKTGSALANMKAALEKLEHGPPGLEITKALRVEHTLLTETLKQTMTEEWIHLIRLSKPDSTIEDNDVVTFNIQKTKTAERLSSLCQTFHSQGMLRLRLKVLAEALILCFDWIVNYPKTTVSEESTDADVCLCITRTTHKTSPSSPATVFKALYNLIKPLAHHIHSTFNDGKEQISLMSELSTVCGSKPIDIIIKGCLAPSVPTSQSDLGKYKDVVAATEKIEGFFAKIGFISPDSKSMTSYMSNLNVLFANKKCQEILSQARKLMKADLYNTIKLEPGDDSANWAAFVAKPEVAKEGVDGQPLSNIQSQMAKLSENTLKFPSCSISETTVELMKLAHSMLEEACTSTNAACSSQIVYAVRSMFELYTSVVSDYHRSSIETLPQVTALYYNNCMYLSHQLVMLASQYKARLSKIMNDGSAVTFVDLVPLLRALGTEAFLDQLENQRDNLLDCLRGAEGFKNMEVEERFQQASQSVKQCLHQLSHLKKVWVEVLPLSNYCKAVGHLLACVIKEMINCIQSLEDMSADDTTKLHHLIAQVQGAAADLFPGDKSAAAGHLHKNTTGWTRFNELAFILTASLHDIIDRWAEGKGPLAVEFTPEQVKAFIRALFQNTERRAAAINKIH